MSTIGWILLSICLAVEIATGTSLIASAFDKHKKRRRKAGAK